MCTDRLNLGPLKFKKDLLGIDVDELATAYSEKIANTATNAEFYYLMRQFIAEFKDSHFGSRVPSKLKAKLGFTTDLVEGKLIIESVDRDLLPESTFPYDRGDEIVSIGDDSAEDLLKKFSKYQGMGFDLSAKRVAALIAAERSGLAVEVPQGKVNITVRPRLRPFVTKTVELKWIVTGEALDEAPNHVDESDEKSKRNTPNAYQAFQASISPMWKDLGLSTEKSFRCSGKSRIGIPEDATMIMSEDAPFVAYYHPTEKGNVGYLRIPHYWPRNKVTGEPEMELRFSQYEFAISELEKNTIGLIIDQDHNCGGSVFYLEKLLGLFLDKPYEGMKFQFLASKAEIIGFTTWLDEIDKNTLDYRATSELVDIIKDSWKAGEFMTPKASFRGEAYGLLAPNRIRYTKPIIMLIDELSGSGGDAFPAHMQGEGRALLLGTRTMGAGGHVTDSISPLNYSGITIRMTKSLFYRPDGVAVENNGAVPDIPYEITVDDYVNDYAGYQQFYLKKLLELIPDNPS